MHSTYTHPLVEFQINILDILHKQKCSWKHTCVEGILKTPNFTRAEDRGTSAFVRQVVRLPVADTCTCRANRSAQRSASSVGCLLADDSSERHTRWEQNKNGKRHFRVGGYTSAGEDEGQLPQMAEAWTVLLRNTRECVYSHVKHVYRAVRHPAEV